MDAEQAISRPPREAAPRRIGSDVAVALLVCLPLAVLYFAGVQRAVGRGDSAEFVTAAYTLGLAHPPGYPIYTLIGRLVCLLPGGTIALRMNLLSAACAFLTLTLVFLIVASEMRSAVKSRVLACAAGIIAVTLVGVSPAFWRYAVVAEAYAMNALVVTIFIYLVLAWLRTARPGLLWGSSLALGIAAGTHLSTIFVLPVLVGLVLLKGRSARSLLWSLALFAVGASQYLYVILRAKRAPVEFFAEPGLVRAVSATKTGDALSNGVWYVTGGPWRHSYARSSEGLLLKFKELTEWVALEYPAGILALAAVGMLLVFLLGDRRLGEVPGAEPDGGGGRDRWSGRAAWQQPGARWRWGTLAGIALSQVVFYVSYGPSQIGMVLPLVICTGILAAAGIALLGGLATRALPLRLKVVGQAAIATVAVAAIALWSGWRAFTVHPREDNSAALVAQVIDRLPAGSFLAGVDYSYRTIINYYRVVEKRAINFRYGAIGDDLVTDDLIARGACFVLGTPKNLLRVGRAGIELEPYVTQERAPTVYLVVMPEGGGGGDGPRKSQFQRAAERLGHGGKRSRIK